MGTDNAAMLAGGIALPAITWLLNYLVHSTLLLGGAFLLSRFVAGRAYLLADKLWKVALVGGLLTATLPLVTGIAPLGGRLPLAAADPQNTARQTAAVTGDQNLTGTQSLAAQVVPGAPPSPTAVPHAEWLDLVLLIWLAGAAVNGVRLARAQLHLRRLLRDRRVITDGPLVGMLDILQDQAGRHDRVRLTCSPHLAGPIALAGAEICLPQRALDRLTADQQRSMLAHELAHIARHDSAWLRLAGLLEALFFVQPLNRLARHQIQDGSEYICDDWAVRQGGDSLSMARCLLEVASWVSASPQPRLVPGLVAGGSPLLRRVQRILTLHREAAPERPRRRWLILLAGLPLFVALATPTLALQSHPAAAQSGPPTGVTQSLASGSGPKDGESVHLDKDGIQITFGVDGQITYNNDHTDIVAINAGGSVTIEESSATGSKKLVVRPDSQGNLTRSYTVDGRQQAYDDAARAWLAGLLPPLVAERADPLQPPAAPNLPLPDPSSDTGFIFALDGQGSGGNYIEGSIKGVVTFNADKTDVATIAAGGSFRIAAHGSQGERTLLIEPGLNGALKRSYTVDGQEQPFNEAARTWLAGILPRVLDQPNPGDPTLPQLPNLPQPGSAPGNT